MPTPSGSWKIDGYDDTSDDGLPYKPKPLTAAQRKKLIAAAAKAKPLPMRPGQAGKVKKLPWNKLKPGDFHPY